MTVTVPLGFRISWYSASPFSRVSQDTTLGGFPLAEVQVATRTLSSCPFLARSTAWVPSIQLVGLAVGTTPWHQLKLPVTPASQLCFAKALPRISLGKCLMPVNPSCCTNSPVFFLDFLESWHNQAKQLPSLLWCPMYLPVS